MCHGLIVGGDNATDVLQKHGAIIKRFSKEVERKKIDSQKIIEIQSLLIKNIYELANAKIRTYT